MTAKQKRQQKHLENIIQNYPNTIRAEVASAALNYGCDIENFFSDLLNHGCQSGLVGQLIYYSDTHKFFDKYYNEIEDLRLEFEDEMGAPLQPKGDLKNWFTWFAFEETARKIAEELAIEW